MGPHNLLCGVFFSFFEVEMSVLSLANKDCRMRALPHMEHRQKSLKFSLLMLIADLCHKEIVNEMRP
jgi:hypothetical protein